jgi:hypothetical protein
MSTFFLPHAAVTIAAETSTVAASSRTLRIINFSSD